MINLKTRSLNKELLDGDDIPFDDIRQNMMELNIINTYLGGHAITIEGVKSIIKKFPVREVLTICEIGCGGGDNLLAIYQWCKRKNISVKFIGIDINKECIEFAKIQCAGLNIDWINQDYSIASPDFVKPDIIFSSLFCHHFKEAELINMLHWMKINCSKGFFINDLQRHPLAYYSIKLITQIFSSSYLVKADAPLSVARGFVKNEWQYLLNIAGMKDYTIQWKWAFRYLIICCND